MPKRPRLEDTYAGASIVGNKRKPRGMGEGVVVEVPHINVLTINTVIKWHNAFLTMLDEA